MKSYMGEPQDTAASEILAQCDCMNMPEPTCVFFIIYAIEIKLIIALSGGVPGFYIALASQMQVTSCKSATTNT